MRNIFLFSILPRLDCFSCDSGQVCDPFKYNEDFCQAKGQVQLFPYQESCYSQPEEYSQIEIPDLDNDTYGYFPLGSNAIQDCPLGYYPDITGLKYPWQCKICPIGFYCSPGEMKPTLCPESKTSDMGASSKWECSNCSQGQLCYPDRYSQVCSNGYYLQLYPINVTFYNKSYELDLSNVARACQILRKSTHLKNQHF